MITKKKARIRAECRRLDYSNSSEWTIPKSQLCRSDVKVLSLSWTRVQSPQGWHNSTCTINSGSRLSVLSGNKYTLAFQDWGSFLNILPVCCIGSACIDFLGDNLNSAAVAVAAFRRKLRHLYEVAPWCVVVYQHQIRYGIRQCWIM